MAFELYPFLFVVLLVMRLPSSKIHVISVCYKISNLFSPVFWVVSLNRLHCSWYSVAGSREAWLMFNALVSAPIGYRNKIWLCECDAERKRLDEAGPTAILASFNKPLRQLRVRRVAFIVHKYLYLSIFPAFLQFVPCLSNSWEMKGTECGTCFDLKLPSWLDSKMFYIGSLICWQYLQT